MFCAFLFMVIDIKIGKNVCHYLVQFTAIYTTFGTDMHFDVSSDRKKKMDSYLFHHVKEVNNKKKYEKGGWGVGYMADFPTIHMKY